MSMLALTDVSVSQKNFILFKSINVLAEKHMFLVNLDVKQKAIKSFKGTVISSDPSCKDGNAEFTTVPLNLYLINNVEDIVVFKVLNFDNFHLFFCNRNDKSFLQTNHN